MMLYRYTSLSSLLLCLSILSGCSLLPTSEPITTYQLVSAASTPTTNSRIDTSLRINKPNASGYLSSAKIIIFPQAQQLAFYKGVQWNEATPLMVRNHLLDGFIQAAHIRFISTDDQLLNVNYELDSDLRHYQIDRIDDNTASVYINLIVRLVDGQQKHILATQAFSQRVAIASTTIDDVIKGFSQAQNQLTQAIIQWTDTQLQLQTQQ